MEEALWYMQSDMMTLWSLAYTGANTGLNAFLSGVRAEFDVIQGLTPEVIVFEGRCVCVCVCVGYGIRDKKHPNMHTI